MEALTALRQRFAALTENGTAGEFSFESGWLLLLYKLADEIELLDASCRRGFFIFQVKEKYGRLSFIANCGPEIDLLINQAEASSTQICAMCGSKGTMVTKGWRRVLCDIHKTSHV